MKIIHAILNIIIISDYRQKSYKAEWKWMKMKQNENDLIIKEEKIKQNENDPIIKKNYKAEWKWPNN